MAYLYRANKIDDFDDYFLIKNDETAILWSGFKTGPDKSKLFEHFKKLILLPDSFLFYLKDDETGAVIGYNLIVKVDESTVETSGYSILSKYQGKGMATLLFKLLEEKVRDMNFKTFVAWISENNTGSIKTVEKNGFVRTNTPTRRLKLEAFKREDEFFLYEKKL